jgi:hypothetical protein
MQSQDKNSQNIDLDKIISKFKNLTGAKTKKEIAFILGISPQAYGNREKRDSLLPLFFEWASKEKISVDWLLFDIKEKKEVGVSVENVNSRIGTQNTAGKIDSINVNDSSVTKYTFSENSFSAKAIRLVSQILDSGDMKIIQIMINQLEGLAAMVKK